MPVVSAIAKRWFGAGVLGLFVVLTALAPRHLQMIKSSPAADKTVTAAPEVIQLWFSEELEPGISRISLSGPSGEVDTGKTVSDEGDETSMLAPVLAELPSGTYEVAWRAAGNDGHPVRGQFTFIIASGR